MILGRCNTTSCTQDARTGSTVLTIQQAPLVEKAPSSSSSSSSSHANHQLTFL
jgi:hypothetical protein